MLSYGANRVTFFVAMTRSEIGTLRFVAKTRKDEGRISGTIIA